MSNDNELRLEAFLWGLLCEKHTLGECQIAAIRLRNVTLRSQFEVSAYLAGHFGMPVSVFSGKPSEAIFHLLTKGSK